MTNIVSPAHGGRRRRHQQEKHNLFGCDGCYGGMGVVKGYTTYDRCRDQLYSLHYCNRCSSSSCTSSCSNNIHRTSSSSSSHKYRRGTAWDYSAPPLGISSDLAAAEGAADMDPDHHQDDSAATNYTSSYNNEHEAGSTSKYEEELATVLQETTTRTNDQQIHIGTPTTEEDQGWLQLGIGRSSSPSGPRHRYHHHHGAAAGAGAATSTASSSSGTPAAAELDLFYGCSSGHGHSQAVVQEGMMMTEAASSSPAFRHLLATEFQAPPHLLPTATLGFHTTPPNTFFFQQKQQQQQQQINLGFRPLPPPPPPPTSSSSSMPTRPYLISHSSSICQQIPASVGGDAAGPSASLLNFRVVDVPRRPHSGIWCILQASPNQDKEPFLPQISKSYLRIKDGRMPVLLLMKYLVDKLGLEAESEVEIRCRGQQLQPLMTIQDVRDTVWRPPTAADTLFITSFTFNIPPDSDPAHYVMLLHYHRSHRHI